MMQSLMTVVFMFLAISAKKTTVSIKGENFYINDKITYEDAEYSQVHGLLLNSRLIQGIFDDYNTSTVHNWYYPDTKQWNPMRNTKEFVGNMSLYRSHNLLGFTLGLQGGNPREPDTQTLPAYWIVSMYDFKTGELDKNYMNRLNMTLSAADDLGMIVILNLFYVHQIGRYKQNNTAIYLSINNIISWLKESNYSNIMIDVANECNINGFQGTILQLQNITNTIKYIQNISNHKYPIGTSFTGGHIPPDDVIEVSDIVLMHGNGQSSDGIQKMINTVRNSNSYKQNIKPILFTEDGHKDFNSTNSNFNAAISGHASWGCMLTCDSNDGGDYKDAYQCPPTAWSINTNDKTAFFEAVANYTKIN